jgi:1-phosphofructokinase family hexose kinase
MIVTLTPNPSLDLLFTADRLVWDDANRIPMPRRRAGGQGINVVRAVRALEPDRAALAVTVLGGPVGRELREMLEEEGTPLRIVPLDGETRVFVGVRETATGRALLLNPRGPAAGDGTADVMLEAVDGALASRPVARSSGWFAGCGSLLPGMPADSYARAGAIARRRGFRFVPDCDGEALAAAVSSGCDLLVPNEHEAGRLLGGTVAGVDAAARASRELTALGPRVAAITLGPRGAVATFPDGTWWARPELPESVAAAMDEGSAVGAGDAFLAAFLLGIDRPGSDLALAAAVAAGTAALLGQGSDLVRREDVARVRRHVVTERMA